MANTKNSMREVERRFSVEGSAPAWDTMYAADTDRLEEHNYRQRRDHTVQHVMATIAPGSRVLDLGCGAGPVIAELRSQGVDCTGVDYSHDMLNYARVRLRSRFLDESCLVRSDCRNTPFPDCSFDMVVCLGVISYVEDYGPILEEIHRVLRPGGTAIITFRNKFNLVLSDPVATVKTIAKAILGIRDTEPFKIGRFLDFRAVTSKLDELRFRFVKFKGIGFGPFSINGRPIMSERTSIRVSDWLTRLCERLHFTIAFKWMADVSVWIYQKS
jgi:ubiquinone/menaquinone biosynthesis C-methylase UbiE